MTKGSVELHSLGNEALLELYREAGFGGRVGWGDRPALLVIDMAGAWTRTYEMIGSDLDSVLCEIKRLLAVARRIPIPVFFTTMAYDARGSDLPEVTRLKTPHSLTMTRGSERVQLVPELERRETEPLLEKPRASAFFATNLLSLLISKRVDTVIVTGCSTSGCIRATCESSLDHGFRTIVPAEAVGDRCHTAHLASLFDIDARYADVVAADEVLAHLNGMLPT